MPGVLGATPRIDTTDFQNGLKQMNAALRTLDTGFKTSAASLGDWSKDATGLEKRIDTLQQRLIVHKQKVDALREAYEKAKLETGETSIKTLDAATAYNRAAEALNKDEKELNDTTVALNEMKSGSEQAAEGTKKLGDEAATSEKKLFSFKDVLHGVGAAGKLAVAGIVALGTAAVSAVGAIAALTVKASDIGSEIADLSVKTGIGTTELQEMKYTAEILGVSFETLTGAQSKLTRSMAEAKDGTGTQAEAFKALGISVTDAQGNMRNTKDVFDDTIAALGKIQNPAERDALAMNIFGKSATELNGVIKAGPEGLAKLAEEAHKLGAVIDEDGIAKLDEFGDSLAGLKMGFQGVMATIALSFLPQFQGVTDQAKVYLQDLVGIVQGSGGDVGKIAEGMGELFGRIVTDLAKQSPQMLQTGLTLVKSVLDSITSALPTILPAAISIIKSLVDFITQNLPMVLSAAISILLMLVDSLVQNAPMLVEAAIQAIVALANGLSAAAPTLVPSIVQAVILISQTLLDNLPLLVATAMMLLVALAEGLRNAAPQIGEAAPQIIDAFSMALMLSVGIIAVAGWEIIKTLARAIVDLIPSETRSVGSQFIENLLVQGVMWNIKALQMGVGLLNSLMNGLKDIKKRAVEIGENFINGIISGVTSAASSLYSAIQDIVNNMLDAVTGPDGLDEQSPSKKGQRIGANFGLSIPYGTRNVMRDIVQSYVGMAGQLASAASMSMGGTSSVTNQSSVSSEYTAYYAPVTVVSSRQVVAAEEQVRGRRF
jgi:hypothetical protein